MGIRLMILLGLWLLLLTGSHPSAGNALAGSQAYTAPDCSYNPLVASLWDQSSLSRWTSAVARFSGAEIIVLNNSPTRILSRDTQAMFIGRADARAYEYLLDQLRNWYPESALTEHEYNYFGIPAKNLIVEIPGQSTETVVLTAHLDSTAFSSLIAPGANDNATGSAALLDAARLLRQLHFEKTIRLIWFTGEEAGLVGSRAYVGDISPDSIHAVVNLDMIGWDGDGDRCFEMDISNIVPASTEIAACLADSISAYNLNLDYDWLVSGAIGRSDHVAFWEAGVPAIGMHENTTTHSLDIGACGAADRNPYYHTARDTLAENMHPAFAFDVARAGLMAFTALAHPVEACFSNAPQLFQTITSGDGVQLEWNPVPGADRYRIYRSSSGCEAGWEEVYETAATAWSQTGLRPDWPYAFQVEAVSADGLCTSPPSACVSIGPPAPAPYSWLYFPVLFQTGTTPTRDKR